MVSEVLLRVRPVGLPSGMVLGGSVLSRHVLLRSDFFFKRVATALRC
jgi:hypothetical protein